MGRLNELLVKWQDEALSDEEYEELIAALDGPEAREVLADDFLDTDGIREALAETRAEQAADAVSKKRRRKTSTRLGRVSRLRMVKSPAGIVVSALVGLAAAAAVLMVVSSGQTDSPPNADVKSAERPREAPEPWMPEAFKNRIAERGPAASDGQPDVEEAPPVADIEIPSVDRVADVPPDLHVTGPDFEREQPVVQDHAERALLAYVDTLQGDVEVHQKGTDNWARAWSGAPLYSGDRIRTKYARTRIAFESGSILLMNRFTTLTVDESNDTPRLDMVGGEVFVTIKEADKGFRVHTPQGVAVDLGTKFGVEAKKNSTIIVVAEGSVRAETEQGVAELEVGQEVSLVARSVPPSKVRAARNLKRRLAWTKPLTGVPPMVVRPPADGSPAVVSFTLIDADSDRPIPGFDPMPNNVTIDLAVLPTRRITLRGNTIPVDVPSVQFDAPGLIKGKAIENTPPFTLSGDTDGDYFALDLQPGIYTVKATPYSEGGAKGTPGRELSVKFTVVDAGSRE